MAAAHVGRLTAVEITGTIQPATRAEWRDWLARHYRDRSEIWLVTPRKATGRPGVVYNDAVEEALCFGWIDGIRKSLGEDRLAQRFTPRRDGSAFSQLNRERLARMIGEGRVAAGVVEAISSNDDLRPESFSIPADILDALRATPEAWRHWQGFSPAYRRIRAAYVDTARARDEAEFRKRLDHLVRRTAAGKQFGYGIESYY